MVITNVENYHKFLAPIAEEILFLLSERRRQKKDWNGKREIAPEKIKRKTQ